MDLSQLEARAAERLDPAVHAFLSGGAGDELTLAGNLAAWSRLRLRPHVLRDVREVRTDVTALGTPLTAPVLVAPTGFHRLAHPDAEPATARGAAAAGSLTVVSMRSSVRVEDVASAVPGSPLWFQVYVLRDRGWTADVVRRAAAAGCRALVLTADTPHVARKRRGGFELRAEGLANLGATELDARAEQDPGVTFDDISWLRDVGGLPVLVKGVLRRDDARRCVEAGAAGVVVSNHGGRQLDGALATADALPEVAEAVADRAEVYVDGGLRRGTDVLKALALGARAVMVGRPVLWALAAGGAPGVEQVLLALQRELAEAMALAGAPSLADLRRDLVAV